MTLTWLSQHLDLGESSRAELKRIIAEAQARGDVVSELRGYTRSGGLEYDYGELAAAQSNFLEGARLAKEIGRPWTIQGIAGRMQGAVMAYMRGEWDEALAIADHRDEDPPPTLDAMLDRWCSRSRPVAASRRRCRCSRPCASAGTARA